MKATYLSLPGGWLNKVFVVGELVVAGESGPEFIVRVVDSGDGLLETSGRLLGSPGRGSGCRLFYGSGTGGLNRLSGRLLRLGIPVKVELAALLLSGSRLTEKLLRRRGRRGSGASRSYRSTFDRRPTFPCEKRGQRETHVVIPYNLRAP